MLKSPCYIAVIICVYCQGQSLNKFIFVIRLDVNIAMQQIYRDTMPYNLSIPSF